MPLKKYINGSWVDTSYKRYETGTDAVTTLPVEIFTDGQPVSSYTLKGNTSVSGTPSPQNPVTISGVGNETANLLPPPTAAASGEINGITYNISADGVCTFSGIATSTTSITVELSSSFVIPISVSYGGHGTLALNNNKVINASVQFYNDTTYVDEWGFSIINRTNTGYLTIGGKTINKYIIRFANGVNAEGFSFAVAFSDNSVPVSPFEPYDKYKISILKDLQPLTPMYFSQQLFKIGNTTDDYSSSGTATYSTYKLVLTGQEEGWTVGTTSGHQRATITLPVQVGEDSNGYCTHYKFEYAVANGNAYIASNFNMLAIIDDTNAVDKTTFLAYLAAQYAAGTPVTVYYVRATPTTETVTAPSITTTGGEVSIDVDTTVKPSELDLTYHGWHEHQPLKRENGSWS